MRQKGNSEEVANFSAARSCWAASVGVFEFFLQSQLQQLWRSQSTQSSRAWRRRIQIVLWGSVRHASHWGKSPGSG